MRAGGIKSKPPSSQSTTNDEIQFPFFNPFFLLSFFPSRDCWESLDDWMDGRVLLCWCCCSPIVKWPLDPPHARQDKEVPRDGSISRSSHPSIRFVSPCGCSQHNAQHKTRTHRHPTIHPYAPRSLPKKAPSPPIVRKNLNQPTNPTKNDGGSSLGRDSHLKHPSQRAVRLLPLPTRDSPPPITIEPPPLPPSSSSSSSPLFQCLHHLLGALCFCVCGLWRKPGLDSGSRSMSMKRVGFQLKRAATSQTQSPPRKKNPTHTRAPPTPQRCHTD